MGEEVRALPVDDGAGDNLTIADCVWIDGVLIGVIVVVVVVLLCVVTPSFVTLDVPALIERLPPPRLLLLLVV
jgi:hypothetical protein